MADKPELDPKRFEPLFRITDALRQLKLSPGQLTQVQFKTLLHDLCDAMKAAFEFGLEQAIFYLGSLANDPQTIEAAKEIVVSYDRYVQFINVQEENLRRCGAAEETIADITRHMQALREHLDVAQYDAEKVFLAATDFRDSTCTASEEVVQYVDDEKERFEARKRVLRTYGTGLILSGVGGLAVTAGAAAPYTLIAGGLGSLMLAWQGYLGDPTEKLLDDL